MSRLPAVRVVIVFVPQNTAARRAESVAVAAPIRISAAEAPLEAEIVAVAVIVGTPLIPLGFTGGSIGGCRSGAPVEWATGVQAVPPGPITMVNGLP